MENISVTDQLQLQYLKDKEEKYYEALSSIIELQEQGYETDGVIPTINYLRNKISSIQIEVEKIENGLCDFCGVQTKALDSNYCNACKHENLS